MLLDPQYEIFSEGILKGSAVFFLILPLPSALQFSPSLSLTHQLFSLTLKSWAMKFKYVLPFGDASVSPFWDSGCIPLLPWYCIVHNSVVKELTSCVSSHQGCSYPGTNIFEKKDSTHHLTHTHHCHCDLRNPQVDGEGQNFLLRDKGTLGLRFAEFENFHINC